MNPDHSQPTHDAANDEVLDAVVYDELDRGFAAVLNAVNALSEPEQDELDRLTARTMLARDALVMGIGLLEQEDLEDAIRYLQIALDNGEIQARSLLEHCQQMMPTGRPSAHTRAEEILAAAEREARRMRDNARQESTTILANAQAEARKIEADASERAARILGQAQRQAQDLTRSTTPASRVPRLVVPTRGNPARTRPRHVDADDPLTADLGTYTAHETRTFDEIFTEFAHTVSALSLGSAPWAAHDFTPGASLRDFVYRGPSIRRKIVVFVECQAASEMVMQVRAALSDAYDLWQISADPREQGISLATALTARESGPPFISWHHGQVEVGRTNPLPVPHHMGHDTALRLALTLLVGEVRKPVITPDPASSRLWTPDQPEPLHTALLAVLRDAVRWDDLTCRRDYSRRWKAENGNPDVPSRPG